MVVMFELRAVPVQMPVLRGRPPQIELYECNICAGLVTYENVDKHSQFHIDQEERLNRGRD